MNHPLTIEQLIPWIFFLISQIWLVILIHTPTREAKLLAGLSTITWLTIAALFALNT